MKRMIQRPNEERGRQETLYLEMMQARLTALEPPH